MRRSRELLFNRDTLKLELLLTPLNRLGLTIEGTPLEDAVRIARADLKRLRLTKLEPFFYLSTGYGTVAGTTSIALGFYDCTDILKELNQETRRFYYTYDQMISTVRHELGHAFSYAYKLYRRDDFREVFNVKGNYFNTYPEDDRYLARANPWSRNFVNPSGDHYAQKHPDDDFAETFLVWMEPDSDWRQKYRTYPGALRKLAFVDYVVNELRNTDPLIDQKPQPFEPLESFKETLAHFLKLRTTRHYRHNATGYIDPDLQRLFANPRPILRNGHKRERDYVHADSFIRQHKRNIVAQVNDWIGVPQTVVRDLIDKCSTRTHALDLWVRKDNRDKKITEFTTFVSYRCALYALNDSFLNGRK